MKKVANFIVEKRKFVLGIFVVFTVVSIILTNFVHINNDMAEYLPSDSSMKNGMEHMSNEFAETNTVDVMFRGLTDDQKQEIYEELSSIEYIDSVTYDKDSEEHNKEDNTRYIVNIVGDSYSSEAASVVDTMKEMYDTDYEVYFSGMVIDNQSLSSNLSTLIILAVSLLILILLIMCESWLEPFLFLTAIAIAIVINMGTNVIFPSVSATTHSIAAILQLALSMDYSIMLIERYRQEKEVATDKYVAMKLALAKGFPSIGGSSVTTIVGLLCLVFMSFKIGMDMGLVLAKGVFISLVCIFFILPAFILMFDRQIEKSSKKTPKFKMDKLAAFGFKARHIILIGFLLLFVVAYQLKDSILIEYTVESNNPDKKVIEEVFEASNPFVVLYPNTQESKLAEVIGNIETLEGVNNVSSYANSLGKTYTSKELAKQMSMDASLLDILFYYYFKDGETGKLSLQEFFDFIIHDVSKNEQFAEYFDDEVMEQLNQFSDFTDATKLTKEMAGSEIASILGMDEASINQLFLYYFSTKGGVSTEKMTLPIFVNFLRQDVASNEEFATLLDEETKKQLDTLATFTNTETITQARTSEALAKSLGMERTMVDQIFMYYFSTKGNADPGKITLPVFVNFLKQYVVTNPTYASYFDAATLAQIDRLGAYTDVDTIRAKYKAPVLAAMLGMEEDMVAQLYYLYYSQSGETSSWKLLPTVFIDFLVNHVVTEQAYAPYFDEATVAQLNSTKVLLDAAVSGESLSSEELGAYVGMDASFVEQLFVYAGSVTGETVTDMTLPQFVDFLLTNVATNENFASSFDESTIGQLQTMQQIMALALSGQSFTSSELATYFNMDATMTEQLFYAYFSNTGETADWTISLFDFVDFLVSDVTANPMYASYFDESTMAQLTMMRSLMMAAVSNKAFDTTEMSNVLSMDQSVVSQLYFFYTSVLGDTSAWKMSLQQFVNFLVDDLATNAQFSSYLDATTRNQLATTQKLMNAAAKGNAYTHIEMAQLVGMDETQLQQLFLYYTSLYGDISSWKMTLQQFVNFLVDEVLTSKEFSSMFDTDKKDQLMFMQTIVNAVVEGTMYSYDEIGDLILSNSAMLGAGGLNEGGLNKDTISLLYLYYFGKQESDPSWNVSLYDFMNFIADDVLTDERFSNYFDEDSKKQMLDAKGQMALGKEALLGKNYSRFIIDTSYEAESEEVDAFIASLHEMLQGSLEEYYIIGDSAMAYEMKQTFQQELNYISLLTAIAIFIVVAITFHSLSIPAILVLIIQCAVYLAMGMAYIQGIGINYLAIIIVQAILMGAAIDYGILYTNYYVTLRKTESIKDSLAKAYTGAFSTIFTSSSILIIITLIVGLTMKDPTTSQVCLTISKGALIATILIVFILPGILAACDKLVCRSATKKQG